MPPPLASKLLGLMSGVGILQDHGVITCYNGHGNRWQQYLVDISNTLGGKPQEICDLSSKHTLERTESGVQPMKIHEIGGSRQCGFYLPSWQMG